MTIRKLTGLFTTVSLLLLTRSLGADRKPLRRSIILISVDTLSADHLSAYGYGRRTSPVIDALAARGLEFENAVVPQPQTSPSHASLLTGVMPWKHGLATNGFKFSDGIDRLSSALRRIGYDTAGIVSVPHLGSSRGFAVGFNHFSEPGALNVGEALIAHRRHADEVNAEAKRAIDLHVGTRRGEPLFLFVHYFDCHFPYRSWDPRVDQSQAYAAEELANRPKQIQSYDSGVSWTDSHIGELLKVVKAKLGDDVIIAITADHGEQIGDHGLSVGHADIYRETVRVPLIIAGSGLPAARINTTVSTMDVPVTLAAFAGAQIQNTVDGLNLLDIVTDETSLLHRLFGIRSERPLVVLGAPTYSRSLGLVKGSSWYIKNFDYAYRYSHLETPARPGGIPGRRITGKNVEGSTVYSLEFDRYTPFLVTFEHIAKSPQCSMTAMASIDPGVFYFRQPITFKGSIRLTLPAARHDSLRLELAPSACVGQTTVTVTREPPPGTLTPPDFFQLLVGRRLRTGDELYDVDDDPLLHRNLIAEKHAESAAASNELQTLFRDMALRAPAQRVPPETLKALRSLGYL
ncbi:MAG: arylsulfatase [Thermoanaerobaculia bacterium]|jgi:hypothetical protein|nr:arylsulfatase [Thermoanaerobaculia bacterium]